ncbi:hypothetical protein [Kribbella catacumbae]|uniref:hypothetical protein n=1 Tax=Kribbella catacumbae TaxID=460086 RepID=UPI00037231FC|nr:hypothetical protein [Kribbella catacumbae]
MTRRDFKASCHLSRDVLVSDATREQLAAAESDGAGRGRWVDGAGRAIPVACDFTTNEPPLFDAHMAEMHGRKLGMVHAPLTAYLKTGPRFSWRQPTPAWIRDAAKRWKWRPAKNPKPYAQKPMQPGAQVFWTQYVDGPLYFDEELGRERPRWCAVERTGQVWSHGYDTAVWVVPEQPWRDELAVLLRRRKSGGELEVTSTYSRRSEEE